MSTATLLGRTVGHLLRSRTLMRLPIHLYRARLGFLLGTRLLMLEHRGRRTGARRRVVLEVIGRPAPGVYVVASGFGRRAQWFRNVSAEPRVRLSTGWRGPRPAVARVLGTAEADAALHAYAARHRRAWDTMRPALERALGSRSPCRTRHCR
ncbi:nitroreductase family deazaflavin-dependent oxidoreductase [Pseudonocardia oceani]|uniref:nitroreductase family deazaflavin-dependent oxidoreductase n=1 Tax=Pseudonocardia oceani TaxID=2792013 RepID=UPI001CEC2642|nr:nitroreductase family deazaflavin-dependent oxidoreductase [Pseudonocardia oceani]